MSGQTDEQRRIEVLEHSLQGFTNQITKKLDELKQVLFDHLIDSAKSQCPEPGICLVLKDRAARQDDILEKAISTLTRHETRLVRIEVVGLIFFPAVASILTIFGPAIRAALGLP